MALFKDRCPMINLDNKKSIYLCNLQVNALRGLPLMSYYLLYLRWK